MQRVLAFARAVLFPLDLRGAAGNLQLRAVVQVAALAALQPDHFAGLFCHYYTCCKSNHRGDAEVAERSESKCASCSSATLCVSAANPNHSQARIFVTTPEPTVLPPS